MKSHDKGKKLSIFLTNENSLKENLKNRAILSVFSFTITQRVGFNKLPVR